MNKIAGTYRLPYFSFSWRICQTHSKEKKILMFPSYTCSTNCNSSAQLFFVCFLFFFFLSQARIFCYLIAEMMYQCHWLPSWFQEFDHLNSVKAFQNIKHEYQIKQVWYSSKYASPPGNGNSHKSSSVYSFLTFKVSQTF